MCWKWSDGDPTIYPSHPNPVRPGAVLNYSLPHGSHVNPAIFDPSGRNVRNLVDEDQEVGRHVVAWDVRDRRGRDFPSGVYFARLRAGGATRTLKLIVAR